MYGSDFFLLGQLALPSNLRGSGAGVRARPFGRTRLIFYWPLRLNPHKHVSCMPQALLLELRGIETNKSI